MIRHAPRTEPIEPSWKLPKSTTFLKKMIHEQLPLPVPCYDLAPLTESSLGPLARNFGYPQLAWLDGRWVQDSGTYSSPRSWLAITSDSSFMRSGFRPQSELRPALVRLISAFRHRSALYRPLYHVCGPGHQRAMLIWRHPRLPPNYLGQSPVTFKTQGKGCVRYPN